MSTGSIRVSFDEWMRVWDHVHESDLTGFRPNIGLTEFTWRGHMITFTQITQIESIRRRIETLQEALTNQAKAVSFAIADDVGSQRKWDQLPVGVSVYLRETLCKVTVAEIVKLLDEAAKLGVDTDNEKRLLLDFLKEIAPKETPV